MNEKPGCQEVVELIRTKDKRIGLRMIYDKYGIHSEDDRALLKKLWDELAAVMDDVYVAPPLPPPPPELTEMQKRVEAIRKREAHARKKRKTKKDDGNRSPQSGPIIQEEQGRLEDVQNQTA
jgi:isochorismate hydrolase